jgi:hypothetical protein
MHNHYRKPRFHVLGLTALLLKGLWGSNADSGTTFNNWF